MIGVSGELQSRTYEDKNGNRRKAVEINVSNVCFAGSKNERPTEPHKTEVDWTDIEDDGDLPF